MYSLAQSQAESSLSLPGLLENTHHHRISWWSYHRLIPIAHKVCLLCRWWSWYRVGYKACRWLVPICSPLSPWGHRLLAIHSTQRRYSASLQIYKFCFWCLPSISRISSPGSYALAFPSSLSCILDTLRRISGIKRIIFNLLSLPREVSCAIWRRMNCFSRLSCPSFGSHRDCECRWENRFLIGCVIIQTIDGSILKNYTKIWNSFEITTWIMLERFYSTPYMTPITFPKPYWIPF